MRHWPSATLLFCLLAPVAHGAPKPRGPKPLAAIVNVARAPTEEAASEVLAGYEALGRAVPNWDLLPDLVARRLLAGSVRDWPLEAARRLLAQGRLAQAALKLDEAISLLKRAERLLLEKVPTAQSKPVLRLVWASLVAAHHAAGQIAEARRAAARLALVSQDGAPLPPALWSRYRPSAAFLTQPAHLRLRAPGEARVWVNFEPAAPTGDATGPARPGQPAAAWKLWEVQARRQTLFLAVELPGHVKFFRIFTFQAGEKRDLVALPSRVPANPHASLARWWFERLRQGVGPKELQELGWRLHADLLVVTDSSARRRTFRLFQVANATFQDTAASLTPKALAAWRAGVPEARPVAAARKAARAAARKARPAPARTIPKHHKAKPLWKKWYFWVVIGAVVIGATAFALTKRDQGQDEVEIRVFRP